MRPRPINGSANFLLACLLDVCYLSIQPVVMSMMSFSVRLAVALLAAVLLSPSLCLAQVESIGGARSPASGGRILMCSVAMQGPSVGAARISIRSITMTFHRELMADGSGAFTISGVPTGTYNIEIEAPGFRTLREQIEVPPGTGILPFQFLMRPLPPEPIPAISRQGSVSAVSLNVPASARRKYEEGIRELEQQRYEAARKHIEKALKMWEKFPEALYDLARLDIRAGKLDSATNLLERSISYDSSYAYSYYLLSFVHNMVGRSEVAFTTAQKGLSIRSDIWQMYYEMGLAALILGRFSDTQAATDRIHQLAGDKNPEYHLLRAGLFLQASRPEDARADLEAFLSLAPTHRHAVLARQTLAGLAPPSP